MYVWVLHMRQINFTFQFSNLTKSVSKWFLVKTHYMCVAENSRELPDRAWNPVLWVHCSKVPNVNQSNVSLGHPYWIFFYVHKTARWRWGFCHYLKVVDMVDLLSVFVSICFYCYCSRFISMSFFFVCVHYNLGDVITQLLHCPGSHFYISLRTVSAHASQGFCGRRALKIRYCCIFVKSRTGLGLINCFYCCVSRELFLYTVCEMFLFLLAIIMGFNLWKKQKTKEKAQKEIRPNKM